MIHNRIDVSVSPGETDVKGQFLNSAVADDGNAYARAHIADKSKGRRNIRHFKNTNRAEATFIFLGNVIEPPKL